MRLELDFLSFYPSLRITQREAGTWVFDPIRRKEVVLTPEELLRQMVLAYLLSGKKYPAHRVRSEVGIEVNGLRRRCDLLVYDLELKPWLLVECKSPKVALDQSTFEQAARYNLRLKAPFLCITNGIATYCAAIDLANGTFSYLPAFPEFPNTDSE